MALAALACGHMTVSPCTWNPLALKGSGGRSGTTVFFGAELAGCRRGPAGADSRRVRRGIEAASTDPMGKGGQSRETMVSPPEQSSWLAENVKRLARPTMAVMLSLLLTQGNPEMANAAGGGRVGGRVGGGGSSFSSKSYSAPSRSYSGPSSGGYSRQYIAPSPGFSYGVPYAAPSPFFGGGLYAAPAYGIGLGGGSIFFLVILGFIILQAVYGFVSERSGLSGSLLTGAQKVSVLKLQVGLLGMGRTLQRDLDRIAGQADTTTAEGLHYVLTETCLSLMRHPDYCISGVSSQDIGGSSRVAEERFNNISLEERGKFDEETLVNVNNLRKRMMGTPKSDRFNNEYIVVTILVAAEGEFKLPVINDNTDLKAALRKLGSIPSDSIQAVEVLWTPQDENDTLSERELLRDYPLLRSL